MIYTMMTDLSNGAATSLAYQGGTSGPRGKRMGNKTGPTPCPVMTHQRKPTEKVWVRILS